jgi:hypothetical protein
MDNTYNWDEKGFLVGIASATQRILTLEALQSGRIKFARQDGCREWISLLAAICGDNSTLPPAIIYKAESGDIQDSWVEEMDKNDAEYVTATPNGWTNDVLGTNWLGAVFDRHTRDKAGNRRRLLIVDGHSSHVNMAFINLAHKLRILLLILPPHSTHRLQPLDVGLFSPLARYYTNSLNELMYNSHGVVSMSKRLFLPFFRASWVKAFTPQNIASAWAKSGLFPFAPHLVLSKIVKPKSPVTTQRPRTPMTSRAIRKHVKSYVKSPTKEKTDRMIWALERLAAQHTIDLHIIKEVKGALRLQKRRQQRGKRLNLVGEEGGGAQFFSPARVQAARDYQATKEEEKLRQRSEIADKKAKALAAKQEKELQKAQRALQREEKRRIALEEKAQKAAEKQAQMELKERAKQAQKAPPEAQKASTKATTTTKRDISRISGKCEASVSKKAKVVVSITSKGRAVQRPQRFT